MKRLCLLLLVLSAPSYGADPLAQSWLCLSELSTGFKYKKSSKRWEITNFNVDDEKFVVRVFNERTEIDSWFLGEFAMGSVTRVGEERPVAVCEKGIDEYGFLFCSGLTEEFRFNLDSLTFMSIYLVGYVHAKVEPESIERFRAGNTPNITIGRCTKL